MKAGHWFWLTVLFVLFVPLLAGCGLLEAPPAAIGPPQWQLTVSPQEPAAGIKGEVTLQRLDADGKRLPFARDRWAPIVRALNLVSGLEVAATPRNIDHRGAWLYDIVFPETGRWQIAFDPGQAARPDPIMGPVLAPALGPVVEMFAWSAPPAVATAVVRDAIGGANLSLVVQVISDRGPILWFLRIHILEAIGFVVILTASVVSYLYRQRRSPSVAARA